MTCSPKGTAAQQLVLPEWRIFLTSSATGRNSLRDRAGVPVFLVPRLHFVRVGFQLHIIFKHCDPMSRAPNMPTAAAARERSKTRSRNCKGMANNGRDDNLNIATLWLCVLLMPPLPQTWHRWFSIILFPTLPCNLKVDSNYNITACTCDIYCVSTR